MWLSSSDGDFLFYQLLHINIDRVHQNKTKYHLSFTHSLQDTPISIILISLPVRKFRGLLACVGDAHQCYFESLLPVGDTYRVSLEVAFFRTYCQDPQSRHFFFFAFTYLRNCQHNVLIPIVLFSFQHYWKWRRKLQASYRSSQRMYEEDGIQHLKKEVCVNI